MVRKCWVNLQCRGVLLIWIIVGQGPTALAEGAGGGLDIFFLIYHFSLLSPSFWEMARYRLKYCLKRPLNPNQLTNHICSRGSSWQQLTNVINKTKSFHALNDLDAEGIRFILHLGHLAYGTILFH